MSIIARIALKTGTAQNYVKCMQQIATHTPDAIIMATTRTFSTNALVVEHNKQDNEFFIKTGEGEHIL